MRRKRNIRLETAICMAIAVALILPGLSTADSLEPSDPPGPTMYTLEEIHKAVTPLPTGFELWANNTRFAVSEEGTPEDHSNDVVLDRATELIWTRDANLGGTKNWEDAVNYCDSLWQGRFRTLANDWRLSSIEELTSLSEPYPSTHNPALPAGHPFENVQSGLYWSAPTSEWSIQVAWLISMGDGNTGPAFKFDENYVWCVRGGP